ACALAEVPDGDFGLCFSCSYDCRPRDSTVRKSNSRIALACVDPVERAATAATTIARVRLKIPPDLRIKVTARHATSLGQPGRLQRHSLGLVATRASVAMMRAPATNVPRNVPETFDSPPERRRWFTGISRMRRPERAAFICISKFQPYVSSRMLSLASASRRMARKAHMSL